MRCYRVFIRQTHQSKKKGNTLKFFLEFCLTLAKDHDALVDIVIIVYRWEEGKHDCSVTSLQKKKTRREMRMNVHII